MNNSFFKRKNFKSVSAIPKDIKIKNIVAYINKKVVFSIKTGSLNFKIKKKTEIIIA